MFKFHWVVWCVVLLGCDGDGEKGDNAASVYSAPAQGMILNSTFELSDAGLIESWMLVQHAGPVSYEVTSEEGVVSLARTGNEPWGKLRQVFRGSDAQSMQGKVMEFSAEVSGDFNDLYGKPIGPSVLGVIGRGSTAGAHRMFGSTVLFREVVPVAPVVGHFPWRRHKIAFSVPAVEVASLVEVEVYFLMTYGGVVHLRGPALYELE